MTTRALRSALFLCSLALLMSGCAGAHQHGTLTRMSTAGETVPLCSHEVPESVCTRCHPDFIAKFKEVGDWCPPHKRPESQCLLCHPDLKFAPLPPLPAEADYAEVSAEQGGQPLKVLSVPGKVTIIEFYATWCAGCQNVETALRKLLTQDPSVAMRRVSVTDWESPAVAVHLSDIAGLPYLVVLGSDGRLLGTIQGYDEATFETKLAAIRAQER